MTDLSTECPMCHGHGEQMVGRGEHYGGVCTECGGTGKRGKMSNIGILLRHGGPEEHIEAEGFDWIVVRPHWEKGNVYLVRFEDASQKSAYIQEHRLRRNDDSGPKGATLLP